MKYIITEEQSTSIDQSKVNMGPLGPSIRQVIDLIEIPLIDKYIVIYMDKDKEYFFCSNSALVKQMIMDTDLNIKLFRGLDNHNINHIPNGFVHHGNQKDVDTFFAVGEMIILAKSKIIHYDGEQSYPSLFNWYANVVKDVKLIDYAK
jgi:hypothetical protein